ncbi:methyltransferase [Kribbella italica]|uniref:SAM-dependent methyltransferase n=1 Tax=Kribbella italica TaxID=1540520 RepID=A0A7W9J1C7_9ACTN|nr:methyltransferase [Kribbella italica]MBB5833335.1 SAM-dependent methyltransferase [Kribbella italica]
MTEIDWAAHAEHLRKTATDEAGWNALAATDLVRPTDRLIVDVGCGGGGMAMALATAVPEATVVALDADEEVLQQARKHTAGLVRCELVSMDDGPEPLRAAIATAAAASSASPHADLIWASASVHHAADQQAAVAALASLLASGGRLALAEGGLPTRMLPWDLGLGEPGLELRLDAAQDRWFAAMREGIPGSVPMPYGWTDALQCAGLTAVTTRTVLTEKPVPLSDADRDQVIDQLRHRVARLDPAASEPTGHGHGHASEEVFLSTTDLSVWHQLLDPDSPHFLGRRTDLASLSARSIHVGHAPS